MVKKPKSTDNKEKRTQPMFSDEDSSTADEQDLEERGQREEPANPSPEAETHRPAAAVAVKEEPVANRNANNVVANANNYVRVEVRCMTAIEQVIEFKMKKTATFNKLMTQFCHRFNIDEGSTRFLYDGQRIGTTSTPTELKMEDGDVIEAHVQQTGGGDH